MTVFRATLETVCRDLHGAVAATVMGVDGLPVETLMVGPSPGGADGRSAEIDALLVEYSSVLEQLRRSAEVFGAGALEELTVTSANLTVILRVLTKDYFVAVAIAPGSSTGRGRFLLRTRTDSLVPELS